MAPVIPNPPVALKLLMDPPDCHETWTRGITVRNGNRYRLFGAVPARRETPCPTLYLLDGNAAFDALDKHTLATHPELAVIGIGYETEAGFDFDARSRDYTPPARSGSGLPDGSNRPLRPSGGAPHFLAALVEEIIPALEADLPLDPTQRALWGHSYGGLFALHALIHAPHAFQAFALASPSLWWDEGSILETLAAADLPRRAIALSRGTDERRSDGSAMEDRFGQLEPLLVRRHGMTVTKAEFAGAGHRAALDLSLPGALALASARI